MRVSVVVRARDEAERLHLTLTSLSAQAHAAEIIVVNDGSKDSTSAVLDEASAWMPLRVVTHPSSRGRSAASNAGARAATGDILVFLDGDTLAGPDFVAQHADLHRTKAGAAGRGETFHIRRSNVDRITRTMVVERFADVHALSSPGIYPGTASRRLYELEMDALHQHPSSGILWAAASGSNFSVSRAAFLDAGGFLEDLDLNEHRELALRLTKAGLLVRPVDGARSYHLITGPRRDPLSERGWEDVFYRAHPIPEIKRLAALWESLVEGRKVGSLTEIESAASAC